MTSKLIELNHPMTVQVEQFKDVVYASMRYMFRPPGGELTFGRNGINIPVEWMTTAMRALLEVYNEVTGSTLQIVGENAVPEPGVDDDDI